ncbi:hypothetical protein EMPS_00082 [Entomortierella parvispora]|uniref:Uncharacterized protein n=1 Tax=Entomortierella parvispora TaxID=205924 RepID=A0A9P3LQI0_9FUNG|nr:hypothetical protein EMPS_00082 [Entomortierella parvispora]
MFMLQYQPQIHRVIFLYAVLCLALDIVSLVLAGNVSCYNIMDLGLQAAICVTPDAVILVTYFLTSKPDSFVTAQRTPADWNKPMRDESFRTIFMVGQVLMILLASFWPFYEFWFTSRIRQPLVASCQADRTGPDGLPSRIYPRMSILIRFLHVMRVRNAFVIVTCVLIAFDLRISISRWRRVRKQKRRARRGPLVDNVELWAKAA